MVFEVWSWAGVVLLLASLVVKGFCLVNALMFPAEAYDATGRQTKQTWSAILGIGFAVQIITLGVAFGFIGSLLNIGFLIAALVYLADVRPALLEVLGRR